MKDVIIAEELRKELVGCLADANCAFPDGGDFYQGYKYAIKWLYFLYFASDSVD